MSRPLLLGLYEFACGLALFLPLWLGRGRSPQAALLGLYLCAVLHLTGAGTLWQLRLYRLDATVRLHLLPFTGPADPVGWALNLLLFLPLGFLLPWGWPPQARPRRVLGWGLGLSLLIEGSQLLSSRVTDTDDLLCNALGALLGYGLYRLLGRFLPKGSSAGSPVLYTAAVFVGRFLLFNEFGAARLLYGF